jgi:hypothetical protein
MGVFSCFWLILSGKNLRIMNLGDGQGTSGGVADILMDTENAAGDAYIARIQNQAGDEESDEEVDSLLFACSFGADLIILLPSPFIYFCSLSRHVRMKTLFWIRMMPDLLPMILVVRNQMLVKVVVKKR